MIGIALHASIEEQIMERRKRRSQQEWKQVIEDQESSGLPVKAFCESRAIGLASFYQKRRRISDDAVGASASKRGKKPKDAFIDMGQIDSAEVDTTKSSMPWTVSLDLGDGLKLVLHRG